MKGRSRFLAIVFPLLFASSILSALSGLAGSESAQASGCTVPSAQHATIQSAVDDVDCDTISLAGNIYTETVTINRGLAIHGQGIYTTTVDGNAGGSVFSIEAAGDTVTLTDMAIAHGLAFKGGGVYSVDTDLVLNAVKVISNTGIGLQTGDNGGGIYILSGTLYIGDSILQGNSTTNQGGGIYSLGAVTVISTSFRGNSADDGGGIYSRGPLVVINSSFEENSGTDSGGGIYSESSLSIRDSAFTNNETNGSGGAIHNTYYSLPALETREVTNSRFISNTALIGGGISNHGSLTVTESIFAGNKASSGGGIYSMYSLLNLQSDEFIGNVASSGGGLYGSWRTLQDSSFISNSATNTGGGLFIEFGGTVHNSSVVSNTASSGGGIYGSGNYTITNSVIAGNQASSGGGINNVGRLVLINDTLSGNQANSLGGGIYNGTAGLLHITNGSIVSNTASSVAGIYNNGGTALLANSIIAYSGTAADCGGTIVSLGHNIASDSSCGLAATGDLSSTDPLLGPLQDNGGDTLTHALLTGSPAIDAGSLAAPGSSIGACDWVDQRGVDRPADGDGNGTKRCDIGAYESALNIRKQAPDAVPLGSTITYILEVGNFTAVELTNLLITDVLPVGSTYVSGGTKVGSEVRWSVTSLQPSEIASRQFIVSATQTITNTDFGVTADGGFSATGREPVVTLVLRSCSIPSAEHPTIQSGVNDASCIKLLLTEALYKENVTVNRGVTIIGQGAAATAVDGNTNGSVFTIKSSEAVTLTQLTITNGYASNGGGIHNVASNLSIDSVTVRDNDAFSFQSIDGEGGGGIYNEGGTVRVSDSLFTHNAASSGAGGGISNLGTFTITNSTVNGNSAGGPGGGIYTHVGSPLFISGTTLSNNSSNQGGGGIANNGGILSLSNSVVFSNTLQSAGGAAGLDSSGLSEVVNSEVINNVGSGAGSTGGINSVGTLTMTKSIVVGNTAEYCPGVSTAGVLILNEVTIGSNSSTFGLGYSGGICASGKLTIDSTTIANNKAENTGGIHMSLGTLELTNSTVSGNTAVPSIGISVGGIRIDVSTDVTLTNSTVTNNNAADSGGVYVALGGRVTMQNSILAWNSAAPGNNPDCSGIVRSAGFNLIGEVSAGCDFRSSTGDLTNLNPLLGPLQDNGGDTLTHALLPGSQAIDAGNPATPGSSNGTCEVTDQRGMLRVGRCDIGAFEYQGAVRRTYLPVVLHNFCSNFVDGFDDPGSGWDVGEDEFRRSEYLNGEFRVLTKRSGYLYLYRAPSCSRANYVVEVDARWVGSAGSSYGLIFGITEDFENFYLFDINTDYKDFRLIRLYSGGYDTIVPITGAPAINGGTDANHLKAIRSGGEITLEVNGTVLGTWYDSNIIGMTLAGLVASPYSDEPISDARFDNFSMSEIRGGTSFAVTAPRIAVPAEFVSPGGTERFAHWATESEWPEWGDSE